MYRKYSKSNKVCKMSHYCLTATKILNTTLRIKQIRSRSKHQRNVIIILVQHHLHSFYVNVFQYTNRQNI